MCGLNWSTLKQRYLEHIRYTKYSNPQLVYALHVAQDINEYEPLQDAMTLSQHANNGVHLNTLQQFCIRLYSHQSKLIPEQHAGDRNHLFDLFCDLQIKHATAWRNTQLL
jgi:hypothetical protein